MPHETEIPTCGQQAYVKFVRMMGNDVTGCCEEPNHTGPHVYCIRVRQGVDHNSHALHFYEERSRKVLKPIVIMEMKGRQLTPPGDCAALWQYMQEVKRIRGLSS